MLHNLRRVVNMLIFVLLAPLVGYEEASRAIARYGQREDRIYLVIAQDIERGIRRRGLEYELVEAARNYEMAGLGHDVYFEYLYMYLSLRLEEARRVLSEYYIAVLTGIVSLSLASTALLLLGDIVLTLAVTATATAMLLAILHVHQPQIVRYRYEKPTVGLVVALLVSWLCGLRLDYCILISCIVFTLLFTPQLVNTARLLLNIRERVLVPLLELMWSPDPREVKPQTLLEAEIRRLWELARDVGAPWFIARVNRMVALIVHLITSCIKTGLLYSPFIIAGYVVLLLTSRVLVIPATQLELPFTLGVSHEALDMYLCLQAILAGLAAGKTAHCIGLGVALIILTIGLKLLLVG